MTGERESGRLQIERTEIDGVTVFWTPDARRTVGALQFRTGRSDEAFPQMGITHLVEHLAFFGMGRRPFQTNGFVDHLRTVFYAAGSEDEVVEFFGDVCRHLTALPTQRLTDEARILRTEALRQTPGLPDIHLWYRYGATGFGTLGLVEYGLGSIDAPAVTGWSLERFTAANAVAWFAGEPPSSLRFSLPQGDRFAPVPLVPIEPLPLPAWTPHQMPGIGLGLVIPRRSDVTMAMRIVNQRLEQRLRYDLGRSYEVSLAYVPLNADVGQGTIYASCLDAEAEVVRADFTSVLEDFAAGGPTADEIATDIDGFRRSIADPDAVLGELDRLSFNDLVGHRRDSIEELLAEMSAVTAAEMRDGFATALETAILMGPLGDVPDGTSRLNWKLYPAWSSGAVSGKRFDLASKAFPWSERSEVLVVGPEGISWVNAEGSMLTVRYAECVGMLVDPKVGRILYGRDGFTVRIGNSSWKNTNEIFRLIDASIPKELVVPFEAS